MAGQKHDVTAETWDSMIPQIPQNVSEPSHKTLHNTTQPTQPTNQFSSLGVDKMESWMLQFLSSLVLWSDFGGRLPGGITTGRGVCRVAEEG